MEGQLEDMLLRIAMETQEIQELAEQLTDGQILANEALRNDLEGILSGLQQYYKFVRTQTGQANQNVQSLQVENPSLLFHLEDTHRHCKQLEEQSTALQENDVCLVQQTNLDLHTRQGHFSQSQHSDHHSCVKTEDQPQSQDSHGTSAESNGLHRKLHLLNRKLQQLRKVICEPDALSGDKLLRAVDQLSNLNCSLDALQVQSEDGKLSEIQSETDSPRPKSRSEALSKHRADTRLRSRRKSRAEKGKEEPCIKDPIRLCNVSMGSATQDSGLDLHLLSSPERLPPTGTAKNCHYTPKMREHRHCHTETNHSEENSGSPSCSTGVSPAEGVQTQKDRLRSETEKLQRTLRKHRRVLGVCEQVWCVEQSLMKRRAELRQAQRLLQEAHSAKAQAQCEVEEWQRQAKDSATCLKQTQLQLKELQDEVETVRKSRTVQNRSLDLDLIWSHRLDPSDQLSSLRNELLVQQQEALLSQRSSLISDTEEQDLERFRSELDSTRTELKKVLEDVRLERQELVNLKILQSKELQKLHKTQVQLDQARTQLDQTQELLDHAKDRADQIKTEVDQSEDHLQRTKTELLIKQEEVRQKEEERKEKLRELDQSEAMVDRKRQELTALQQEAEKQRKEAESRLKETEQQARELQEVKEEVEKRKEQSSRLQQQCRHLEDRRRHAHRCLSAVEEELQKLKQEQSQSQLTQAANQEKLNESAELLSFLGDRVDERKVQLQTVEKELCELQQKCKQRQGELQELDTRAHTQAAVTERQDRGRRVTQEQLHKLCEELWERERRLLEREAEFGHKEEELQQKEVELLKKEVGLEEKDLLPKEEELQREPGNSDEESSEEFYLSTAGLRSASSPEVLCYCGRVEDRWRMEVETDKLELKQDSLKAEIRCSLQCQDQSLQERDVETEQSVRRLRDTVERLDSLLHTSKTHEEHEEDEEHEEHEEDAL